MNASRSKPGAQVADGPAKRWKPAARIIALAGLGVVLVALLAAGATWLLGQSQSWEEQAARRAFSAGRFSEALDPLERWLRSSPRSAEAHLLKARVMLALDRPAEFEVHMKQAEALGAPKSELDLVRAILDALRKRHREAYPVLIRAYDAEHAPDPQLDQALARVFLESYDLKRAAAVLDRWAREAPDDPRPHLWKVEIDGRISGNGPQVIEDYKEALRRDPKLAKAHIGLAEEYRTAHRNEEAVAEFEAYLSLKPDDPAGLVGAGRNAVELGDEAAAIRHFDRAIALSPKTPEAYKERAELDLRRGNAGEALALLDRALALDAFDVNVRYSRSLALTRLGREEEAKAERETVKRLREEHQQLTEIQATLVDYPHDVGLQIKVTRWLFDHGHDAEALRWAEKILRDHPGQQEACRLLADYHQRKGNPGLANFYRLQIQGGSTSASPP